MPSHYIIMNMIDAGDTFGIILNTIEPSREQSLSSGIVLANINPQHQYFFFRKKLHRLTRSTNSVYIYLAVKTMYSTC